MNVLVSPSKLPAACTIGKDFDMTRSETVGQGA